MYVPLSHAAGGPVRGDRRSSSIVDRALQRGNGWTNGVPFHVTREQLRAVWREQKVAH
jgi:hypothetical protein